MIQAKLIVNALQYRIYRRDMLFSQTGYQPIHPESMVDINCDARCELSQKGHGSTEFMPKLAEALTMKNKDFKTQRDIPSS